MSPIEEFDQYFDELMKRRMSDIVDRNKNFDEHGLDSDDDRRTTGGGRRAGEFNLGKMSSDSEFMTIFMYTLNRKFIDHIVDEKKDREQQRLINEKQNELLAELTKKVSDLDSRISIVDEFNKAISGLRLVKRIILGLLLTLGTLAGSAWGLIEYWDKFRNFFKH